jgi:hypothetical protein
MRDRVRTARESWRQLGPWRRALLVLVATLQIGVWLGVSLFCLGAVLVAITGGAHFSLIILGVGVLVFLVGAISTGWW